MTQTNLDELAGLRALIARAKPSIIAIDGMNGAGKTTRAARPLGLPVVSLDDFLKGDGHFMKGLRLNDLKAAVSAAPRPLVVEGCCVRAALENVRIAADLHVYVRSLESGGSWEDEEVVLGQDAARLFEEDLRLRKAIKIRQYGLSLDLIEYHGRYQPYQNADYVLDLVRPKLEFTVE